MKPQKIGELALFPLSSAAEIVTLLPSSFFKTGDSPVSSSTDPVILAAVWQFSLFSYQIPEFH
jgi:hypothetical protein